MDIAAVGLLDLAVSIAEDVGRNRRTLLDLDLAVYRNLHPGSTDFAGHRLRRSRLGILHHRSRRSYCLLGRQRHTGLVGSRRTGLQEGRLGQAVVCQREEVDSGSRVVKGPSIGLAGRKPSRWALMARDYEFGVVEGLLWGNVGLPSQL